MLFKTPMIIEVKPGRCDKELMQHTEKIDRSGCKLEVLIVGSEPLVPGDGFSYFHNDSGITFGILDDHLWGFQEGWGSTNLFLCVNGHIGFSHRSGSYTCRICDEYDGDHHMHGRYDTAGNHVNTDIIERAWTKAGNTVRFRGRDSGRPRREFR